MNVAKKWILILSVGLGFNSLALSAKVTTIDATIDEAAYEKKSKGAAEHCKKNKGPHCATEYYSKEGYKTDKLPVITAKGKGTLAWSPKGFAKNHAPHFAAGGVCEKQNELECLHTLVQKGEKIKVFAKKGSKLSKKAKTEGAK